MTKAPQNELTVTNTYDLAGRHLTTTDSNGTWTWGYDTAGRINTVTTTTGSVLGYQLDANSNLLRFTWQDGYYATYAYDALNRMTNVKEKGTTNLATYTYDPLSRRTGLTYGDGSTVSYAYTTNNDLATMTHGFAGSNTVTLTYTYNKDHQIATSNVSNAAYLHRPGSSYSDSYAANNMNQYTNLDGDTSFTYDGNGNLSGLDGATYTYDTENRLVAATASGNTASYVYTPFGMRRKKTVNGSDTWFTVDPVRNQEIALFDGSFNMISRYVFGPGIDEAIAWVDPNSSTNKSYLHQDANGSLLAGTDGNGNVNGVYTYTRFGQPDYTGGLSLMFTGRRYDSETGLYHYRNRAYNPSLGRFMQPDPIGTAGGINLYTYVQNDPYNRVDPFGTIDGGMFGGALSDGELANQNGGPLPSGYQTVGVWLGPPGSIASEECLETECVHHGGAGETEVDGLAPLAKESTLEGTNSDVSEPDNGVPALSFSGSSSNQLQAPEGVPPRNDPGEFNGIPYSGHAFDQMQNRGLYPSVTDQAINEGIQSQGRDGTVQYYDSANNVTVLRNPSTGNVISVRPGSPSSQ